MKWLKSNLGTVITIGTLLLAAGLAWGRLDSRLDAQGKVQEGLSRQLAGKVDRDQVLRELDQVHVELRKIDSKLDGVIIRQAIVAEE